jgi:hypothetical protein
MAMSPAELRHLSRSPRDYPLQDIGEWASGSTSLSLQVWIKVFAIAQRRSTAEHCPQHGGSVCRVARYGDWLGL